MSKRNPEVELSFVEILSASTVGATRRIKSMFDQRAPRAGVTNLWEADMQGALGEVAFAKYLNRYWSGSIDSFGKPDVADVQVRCSPREDACLILRENDEVEHRFVLITGPVIREKKAIFTVRGWLLGKDGKVDAFLKSPNGRPPAWFIPISDLNPMEN